MAKLQKIGLTFKEKLLKRYFVRWHMSAILAATVASGVVIDKGLLAVGFGSMGWRYAVSVLGAYGVFFLLVRMWIWYAAGIQPKVPDFDLPDDVPLPSGGGGGGSVAEVGFHGFQGGDAGGGGASDLFDPAVTPGSGGGGSSGGGFGGSLDLDISVDDEGIWILLALAVLVLIIAGAGGYLIWMAPEILPEVALECAIGAGLVRQLKDEGSGWAGRLLWKTWIPLVIVMVAAFAVGSFIQSTCPGAVSARAALTCAVTE